MRDWTKTLRAASFRGVSFHVENDDASGGRRKAIHEFAGGENSVIEDQGRRTRMFDVRAYLTGDNADSRAHALSSALDAYGPGMLVLPIDGALSVDVIEWRRSRERDRGGYIAFDISVAMAGASGAAGLSLGDVKAVFSGALAAALPALRGLF